MAKLTIEQVVNWFRAENYGAMCGDLAVDALSQMKVMYLAYYAQGVSLALYDTPLFDAEIVHKPDGPMIPAMSDIYDEQRTLVDVGVDRNNDLPPEVLNDYFSICEDRQLETVLETVAKHYGNWSTYDLATDAKEQTPWQETKLNEVFSLSVMKSYFKEHVLESEVDYGQAARPCGCSCKAGK